MKKTAILILIVSICFSNCASFRKENRILTTYLDEKVDPQSAPAKIALAPVFIPVGLTSLVLDVFIIHPITVIPDAIEDTYKVVWKDPSGGVVFQAVVFLPKVAISPLVFLVSFLGRSGFDI
ncbi:hypothetical protein CH352_04535 [Leptospira hartskeerlii]|uniref:Uncharacterized protein n=1 Tax=Leptospira hartskeerlii TaxID=2023177 RepID=A0A2M9XG74_9LEPT|nr:hypothetical protein [Leptospira hartskeerlii]PJZ26649.1 hypothetical protein CH357_03920 [Leptospira hartskeerlii]PJZ34869.1 hypothetical protein CH352_04535 [Leptospira hartskeerlii]